MRTHNVMQRTVQRVGSAVLAVLAAASCAPSGSSDSPDDHDSLGATASALSAEDTVRAACKGTYKNHGQCVSCVAHAAGGNGALVSEFAQGECHNECIRTSCAVEGKTCGSLADGCGGTLSCGPSCCVPTSCAAVGKTCGILFDGCGTVLTCGPPCPVPPLFLPSENNATYRLHEVCTGHFSDKVGTAGSCCRQDTFTTDTTCTTALHEQVDAAGNRSVVIDPVTGCTSAATDGLCSRTPGDFGGDLSRCDANGLTCPAQHSAPPGDPAALAGTYLRAVISRATQHQDDLALAEYRGGCGVAPGYLSSPLTCSTGSLVPGSVAHMATFTRSGAGTFAVRLTSGPGSPAFSAARYCSSLIQPPDTPPLPNTESVTGSAPGGTGTFNLRGVSCTYDLTQVP